MVVAVTRHWWRLSLPTRGAWIEIRLGSGRAETEVSLPTRGAWIEMTHAGRFCTDGRWSLPTRGAWIEIYNRPPVILFFCCRSPHGERGLKSQRHNQRFTPRLSLPTRGAWIEIPSISLLPWCHVSLPTRGAWIEIEQSGTLWTGRPPSLPTRGAWIEIQRSRG